MSEIAELRERLGNMKKYELTEYDVTLTQERAAEIVAEYDRMADRILELETALADARREITKVRDYALRMDALAEQRRIDWQAVKNDRDAMAAVVEAVGRAAAAYDKIQEAYNSESVESAFKDYVPVFEQAVADAIDAHRARAKEGTVDA